jgi:L-asparaginase
MVADSEAYRGLRPTVNTAAAVSEPVNRALPQVLVLGCGGTIASTRGPGGASAVPALDAAALVAAVPELAGLARISARTFSVAPSAHTTLSDVVRLRDVARAWADERGSAGVGVVITQGTDTLEEVAFALDLLWDRATPLVLTGAMRNPSLAGPDGPANLRAAVATALCPQARGAGVLVAFNDEIHAASLLRKAHTANVAAFTSPALGPLGYLAEGIAQIPLALRDPRPRMALERGALVDVPVALVTIPIGDDGRLLDHVHAAGYRGLVIEAMGGGHLPSVVAAGAAVRDLVAEMPVVLSSRTGSGEVLQRTYAFPGSESDLIARGLIPSGRLDGRKSRVLLAVALAGGADRARIAEAFAAFTTRAAGADPTC